MGLSQAEESYLASGQKPQKIPQEKAMITTIKSLAELRKLASNGGIEVSILLAGGAIRSTKFVDYNPATKKWRIESYIDGSTTTRIGNTNIEEAIKKNALITEDA